jgi:hypothetical protein
MNSKREDSAKFFRALPPEKEPFPNRVIFLAAFDTGPKEKYWPGDFEIVEQPRTAARKRYCLLTRWCCSTQL